MKFIATVASGLEHVLAEELDGLGARSIRPGRKSVGFRGDLDAGLRACLWSRTASRILHPLAQFSARNDRELYEGVFALDWKAHWRPGTTIAVDFVGHSAELRDSRYGAMKVKDAICDRLREQVGTRPDVDTKEPDLRINVHLRENYATISIDLAGIPLHVRGRDRDGGPAPLKENLAAAMLILAGWRGAAKEGAVLVDPFCGSGTILIEAADILADRAPGLQRPRWGFTGWLQHDPKIWAGLIKEAEARVQPVPKGRIFGRDLDEGQLARCRGNLKRAELANVITLEEGDMRDARPPVDEPGIWVTNPPYGERLGDTDDVLALHRAIGDTLRRHWLGWTGWVLAGSPKLARQFGLKPAVKYELRNGSLDCRLVCLPINPAPVARDA